MPTRGRPEFARHALRSFLEQDYPNRQLFILDDNRDLSFANGITHPAVIYSRSDERNIAEKRNFCCSKVPDADIYMHFDSDDWSSPSRMREQVDRMQNEGKAVSGYSSAWFYVEQTKEWRLWTAAQAAPYVLGTSLAYTRQWWEQFPFDATVHHLGIGEDNQMCGRARDENQLSCADGKAYVVARVHPANTSYKDPEGWQLMERPEIADVWESQLAT